MIERVFDLVSVNTSGGTPVNRRYGAAVGNPAPRRVPCKPLRSPATGRPGSRPGPGPTDWYPGGPVTQLGEIELDIADGTPDRACVVTVAGEIDLVTAPQLRAGLLGALGSAPAGLLVDLDRVDFLDSTGIAALAHVVRLAGEQDVSVGFCAAQPIVRRVLDVTGLDRVWSLWPDRASGLAGLAQQAQHARPA